MPKKNKTLAYRDTKLACRVCLSNNPESETVSIYEQLQDIKISDAIQELANLQDIAFDEFTKVVCQECADNVIFAFKTKLQCLMSDGILKNTLKKKHPLHTVTVTAAYTKFEPFEGPALVIEPLFVQDTTQPKIEIEEIEEIEANVNEVSCIDDKSDLGFLYEDFIDENDMSFLGTSEQQPEKAPSEEEDDSDGLSDTRDEQIGSTIRNVRQYPNGNLSLRSCCKCLDVFDSYEELSAHFAEAHPHAVRINIPILPADSTKKQCTLCRTIVRSVRAHRRRKHSKDYERRMNDLENKKFECDKCDVLLASRPKLLNHMKSHLKELAAAKSDVIACQICEYKAMSPCQLDKHLLEVHPDDKSIKCNVCGKMMKLATSLKKHMKIHFNSRDFQCEFCDKGFLYVCDLDRHRAVHTKKLPFACKFCEINEVAFATRTELKIHKKDQHPEVKKAVKRRHGVITKNESGTPEISILVKEEIDLPIGADIVIDSRLMTTDPESDSASSPKKTKVMPTKTKAKNHEHYCCKCTETFEAEIYLVNHFNEEHPNSVRYHYDHMKKNDPNTEQCILCKSFVKDMVRHRRRQHGPAPVRNDYQCKHCGKVFKTIKTMRDCELKHDGVEIKRLQCPQCPATLSNRSNLTEHIKLHSEVYRFECHLCGKKCKKSSNLKVHLQSTHSTEKNVKCEICGKAMKKKSSMQIHMRIHTGVRPFKCSYCENTYIHRTDWKRHEMVHTGYRPYECSYCDRGFIKKSSMIEHERSHVVPL